MRFTIFLAVIFALWLVYLLKRSWSTSKWLIVPWMFFLQSWNYVIRPVVLAMNDYWLDNDYRFPTSNEYNDNYLLALLGITSLQLGYLSIIKNVQNITFEQKVISNKNYHKHFVVGASAIVTYLFLRVGTAWLGSNRSVAASVIVPEFRFLFPLFILLLLAYFFRSHSSFIGMSRIYHAFLFFISASIFITMFHVRGYLVYLILWSVPYFKRDKHIIILGSALLVYVVFFSRSVGTTDNIRLDLLKLVSSNGDSVDTWFIVKDYVLSNGYLYGEGVMKNLFNIIPLSMRFDLGLSCSWDLMNIHYAGESYLNTRYGYNLDTSQELFMNFGYLYLPFGFLFGRILGKLDLRIVENRIRNSKPFETAYLFILVQNIFSVATLHWTIFYGIIVYFRRLWIRK